MKIILAGNSHIQQIADLINQIQQGDELQHKPDTPANISSFLAQGIPVLVAVAENDKVAGILVLQLRSSLLGGGFRALIDEVVVGSSYRGQGVGASLIQAAVQVALARRCSVIEVRTAPENRKALAFYSRQGFTHKGVLMELELV